MSNLLFLDELSYPSLALTAFLFKESEVFPLLKLSTLDHLFDEGVIPTAYYFTFDDSYSLLVDISNTRHTRHYPRQLATFCNTDHFDYA